MYHAMQAMPISDLRTRQAEILAQIGREPVMLTHHGTTAGILVSAELWNEMVTIVEEYGDIAIALERKYEAQADPSLLRPISDLRASLLADGLLDG